MRFFAIALLAFTAAATTLKAEASTEAELEALDEQIPLNDDDLAELYEAAEKMKIEWCHKDLAKQLFGAFDTDKNGKLTKREIKNSLKKYGASNRTI